MKKNELNQSDEVNRTSKHMSDSDVRFSDFESDMFIKRLRSVIQDESLNSFANRCGFTEGTLRKYLNGAVPGADKLLQIAQNNGLTVEWLLTGDTPQYKTDLKRALEYASIDPSEIVKNFTGIDIINRKKPSFGSNLTPDQIRNQATENSAHVLIDTFPDVKAAAGEGQLSPTDQTIVQLRVNSADWRNYVGLDHRHVKIISIHGDSMKPTFNHGDQVLVDTACNRLIDDGVYAFMQDDLLRVKRIKLKLNGDIEVKSDNGQGFAPETYTQQEANFFIVFGRVLPFKFGKVDL